MNPNKRQFHRIALATGATLLLGGRAASAATLAERWAELRARQPRLPARDAARSLGVSEAELLDSRSGEGVTRLRDGSDAARDLMKRLFDLGEFMALTRNDTAVIETTGIPRPLPASVTAPAATPEAEEERRLRQRNVPGFLGGPIDLRINFRNWAHAWAVVAPGAGGKTSRSLQFFDAQGDALFKAYLVEASDVAAFERIVQEHAAPAPVAALKVLPAVARQAPRPDTAIDAAEWRRSWEEIRDVHEFSRLLADFGIDRQQGLRLAPAGRSAALQPQAVRALLQGAAQQQLAIMAFVGNGGLTQIFSGRIQRVEEAGGYFNVLDPKFNLHLRDRELEAGWWVDRGGTVSVEFYDRQGRLAVTFFGVHGRGEPQPQAWKELAAGLPRLAG